MFFAKDTFEVSLFDRAGLIVQRRAYAQDWQPRIREIGSPRISG
jgi:hypothetical protein